MPRQCRMPQLSPMSSVGALPFATGIPDVIRRGVARRTRAVCHRYPQSTRLTSPKKRANMTPATIFSALNSLNNG